MNPFSALVLKDFRTYWLLESHRKIDNLSEKRTKPTLDQ
jgi:hypothetical protein